VLSSLWDSHSPAAELYRLRSRPHPAAQHSRYALFVPFDDARAYHKPCKQCAGILTTFGVE